VFDDLAVADTHDVDELECDLVSRRWDACEIAGVRTSESLLRHHLIALGDHVLDRHLAVREGLHEAEEIGESSLAIGGNAGWKRREIHELGIIELP